MTFGEKLKEARKQAGISQEQLAEMVCISRSAIAKWEADLGRPDIENLRSLAQLFHLSMDALADDTLSLQEAIAQSESPAAIAYCGKSCKDCAHKEVLNCRGCKKTDPYGIEGCAIARCCQRKGLDMCSNCSIRTTCNQLRSRDFVPDKRLSAIKTHQAQQKAISHRNKTYAAWLAKAYPILHKWVPLMFMLKILPIAAGLLAEIPLIGTPFSFLSVLLPAGYALLLWKVSDTHRYYKTASIFSFVSVAVSLFALLVLPDVEAAAAAANDAINQYWEEMVSSGQQVVDSSSIDQLMDDYQMAQLLQLIASIIGFAVSFPAMYFEFHAHADILDPFHKEYAAEWLRVWKLTYICAGGALVSVLLLFVLPFLGSLLLLIGVGFAIGEIVAFFRYYRALFRLSRYFRDTSAEEMIRGANTSVPLPS